MSETIIAEDVKFVGKIETPGDVELLGYVEGSIRCRSLLIGEKAEFIGTVAAERIVVHGMITGGTLHGIRVHLAASAHVEAELVCKQLNVNEEAYFSGRSKRVNDPLKDSKLQKEVSIKKATRRGDGGDKSADDEPFFKPAAVKDRSADPSKPMVAAE